MASMTDACQRSQATAIVGQALALAIIGLALTAVAALAIGQGASPAGVAWLLVGAPLVEEAVFRAGLQEALSRRGRRTAAHAPALIAIVFGLAHVLSRSDVSAFVVAVPAWLIGAAYRRSGQLRLCIGLHAGMNAAWIAWQVGGLPRIPGA